MQQQINVLIVEQDTEHRETLRDLLEGEGYAALAAASGHEGEALLRGRRVPCIVLLNKIKAPKTGLEFVMMVEHENYLLSIALEVMRSAANDFETDDIANDVEQPVSAAEMIEERLAYQRMVVRQMRAERAPAREALQASA